MNKIFFFFRLLFVIVLAVGVTNTPPLRVSAAGGHCVEAPSGMVSWWPGDNNALDIVGSHDGTLQNGTTFAAGMVNQAFSFDALDDYITTGTAVLGTAGPITIDAWIKTNGFGDWQTIVREMGTPFVVGEYFFRINPTGHLEFFRRADTSGDVELITTVATVPVGVYTYVAAVFAGGSDMKIYVNGTEAAVLASINNYQFGIDEPGYTLIGATNDQPTIRPAEFIFNGEIDELELFNRALSAQEILSIYGAGSFGKCREVTICHMPGEPAEKTLRIPLQALNGHLGHGDTLGICQ